MISSAVKRSLFASAHGLWLYACLLQALPSSAQLSRKLDEPDFAALLQPVPFAAKFSDPDYYIWCGTMVRGDDGKCHLFYSRWPRKLGHYAWVTHSEVAHAVADEPLGAFRHVDVALPARGKAFWDGLCTHNPTVRRFGNKYYLYYMGNTGDGVAMKTLNWTHRNNQRIGVAVADSPNGPWQRFDKPLIAPTPGFFDALCCANPSVTERIGGGFLMVYKAVGDKGKPPFGGPVLHAVAFSDSPTGPFQKQPNPVFTKEGVAFAAEDPFIWTQEGRYWAIVKDNAGHFTQRGKSTALFESSDGLDWKLAKHALVATTEITWEDGRKQTLNSLERPQLFLENGRPSLLLFACDEDGKREHSFNIRVPLRAPGATLKTGKAASRPDPAHANIADDPKLIFATTTPVSADLHRYVKDSELENNRIAVEVMTALGVQVNDLWAFAKPRIDELQQPGLPHVTAKVSQALAYEIAQQIAGALK